MLIKMSIGPLDNSHVLKVDDKCAKLSGIFLFTVTSIAENTYYDPTNITSLKFDSHDDGLNALMELVRNLRTVILDNLKPWVGAFVIKIDNNYATLLSVGFRYEISVDGDELRINLNKPINAIENAIDKYKNQSKNSEVVKNEVLK